MRTKTLLSIAALTAAGVATSMAQSNVYSLNIVGYCNVPTPTGFSFQSNPLNVGTNGANQVINNFNPDPSGNTTVGPYDGSSIQEWTGTGWKVSQFDSFTDDTTTGFTFGNGAPNAPVPILSSGKGYLINNQGAAATNGNTITYVGDVRTGTNITALAVRPTPYAIGSMLPISGPITGIGLTNYNPDPSGNTTVGPLDGCSVAFLNVNGGGQAAGFTVTQFDSFTDDTTTGFTFGNGAPNAPVPQVSIGQGFFLFQQSSLGTFNWTQVLNVGP